MFFCERKPVSTGLPGRVYNNNNSLFVFYPVLEKNYFGPIEMAQNILANHSSCLNPGTRAENSRSALCGWLRERDNVAWLEDVKP